MYSLVQHALTDFEGYTWKKSMDLFSKETLIIYFLKQAEPKNILLTMLAAAFFWKALHNK